jgi:hypothetical protein
VLSLGQIGAYIAGGEVLPTTITDTHLIFLFGNTVRLFLRVSVFGMLDVHI